MVVGPTVVSAQVWSIPLPGVNVGIKVGLAREKGKTPPVVCGWVRSQIESTTTMVQADTRTLMTK